jgi:thiol-disulfide isomerase/thioredoxin
MTTRRRIIAGATLACLYGPALAKPGDLSMPPQLSELRDLSLATPGGAATTLGRHLATGTATVVSLWATWCGPCSNEAAHLAEVRSRISTERLNIVGINVDSKPDEAKIANFLKRSGVNFTQLRGESKATYLAFNGQLPISLPRLYIFVPSGAPAKVFGRYDGRSTLRAIDQAIETAMKA